MIARRSHGGRTAVARRSHGGCPARSHGEHTIVARPPPALARPTPPTHSHPPPHPTSHSWQGGQETPLPQSGCGGGSPHRSPNTLRPVHRPQPSHSSGLAMVACRRMAGLTSGAWPAARPVARRPHGVRTAFSHADRTPIARRSHADRTLIARWSHGGRTTGSHIGPTAACRRPLRRLERWRGWRRGSRHLVQLNLSQRHLSLLELAPLHPSPAAPRIAPPRAAPPRAGLARLRLSSQLRLASLHLAQLHLSPLHLGPALSSVIVSTRLAREQWHGAAVGQNGRQP